MRHLRCTFTRKTAVGLLLAIGLSLMAIICIVGQQTRAQGAGLHTTEERVAFLASLGWEADPASETQQEIRLPEVFDAVLENYNQLQLEQGYDLSAYCGHNCTLYSYTLLRYPNSVTDVIACLYLYKGKVIGGDIHAVELDGFMHGIR